MHRVLAEGAFCVSFYGWPGADKFLAAYRAAGFRVAGHFVFPTRYTSKTRLVRYQHECARLRVKGSPWARNDTIGGAVDWTYSGNKLHPTQKPLSVLMQLIEAFSAPGDLVLDPFASSGNVLAEAEKEPTNGHLLHLPRNVGDSCADRQVYNSIAVPGQPAADRIHSRLSRASCLK